MPGTNTTPENKYDDLEIDDVLMGLRGIKILWRDSRGYYGELTISKPTSDAVLIDHECMTAEFCKAVMNKLIDKYYKQ